MEAIILAGGLGTRLKSMVNEVPKSMALIKSRPFMEYQLDQLIKNGISRFIFSVGYKADHIRKYFLDGYRNCEIIYAIEETQLGTGGAIKNAMKYTTDNHVVVINGDSLFISNLQAQYKTHLACQADITLALKPMKKFDRYGSIELDDNGKIQRFLEKKPVEEGAINAGLYIFNVNSFKSLEFPEKFSIEKDVFEARVHELNLYGFISNGYFLDIGIPADFVRAQLEIGLFPKIDKTWTLFLDRDGVINRKIDNGYVRSVEEFEFIPNVLSSLVRLSKLFGKIIIVTNQQGVGKGVMTEEDLNLIHDFLLKKVSQKGGKIDAIYHAPQLVAEDSIMRKPQIGMAIRAKEDFPEIDFKKSIMVGDSQGDMEFGKRAGMSSILVNCDVADSENCYSIDGLANLSELLTQILQPSG